MEGRALAQPEGMDELDAGEKSKSCTRFATGEGVACKDAQTLRIWHGRPHQLARRARVSLPHSRA